MTKQIDGYINRQISRQNNRQIDELNTLDV